MKEELLTDITFPLLSLELPVCQTSIVKMPASLLIRVQHFFPIAINLNLLGGKRGSGEKGMKLFIAKKAHSAF